MRNWTGSDGKPYLRCRGKGGLLANQTICFRENFMKSTVFVLCSSVALWAFPFAPSLSAADMASPTDRAFVGKVSQGGMYEVEASKIAAQKATAQDVKDLAI